MELFFFYLSLLHVSETLVAFRSSADKHSYKFWKNKNFQFGKDTDISSNPNKLRNFVTRIIDSNYKPQLQMLFGQKTLYL